MRYATLAALALITTALPALAQDRTPPAGSLRALEAPVDVRQSQFGDSSFFARAPFEGRSVFAPAPATTNSGDAR